MDSTTSSRRNSMSYTDGFNDNDSDSGLTQPPPSTIYSSSIASASQTSLRSTNTAPSIRSRVTVVCAECKRLKLKCDRRIPCGSCTKRDTIPRCIYSQAATEKIDVQTLHNRLSTVEATLTTVVSSLKDQNHHAATPSSSNPEASGSSGSVSGGASGQPRERSSTLQDYQTSTGARLLAVAPNGASVVVNLDETAGLWVSDLEAELGREGPRFDLRPADRSYRPIPEATPRSENGARPATARDLLHRHIGIAVAPFSELTPGAPGHDPYADLVPELLSQFPSEVAWGHMMRKFEGVIQRRGAWCIPFTVFKEQATWLMTFAPNYKGKAKARTASLNGEGEVDGKPSLSLLANVAIGLAMGSLCWVAEDALRVAEGSTGAGTSGGYVASPPASAFGVHSKTPHALYRLGRLALTLHYERHGYAALDELYLLAQLMCGGYLLLAHREEGYLIDGTSMATLPLSLPPDLPPLVAEACLNARVMGLNTDPDDFASFGDTSISGSRSSSTIRPDIGQQQSVKFEDGTVNHDVLEGRWGRMSLYRKEVRRRLWWEVCWFDMFVAENLGIVPNFKAHECTTRIPSYIDDDHMSEDPDTRMTPLRDEESQATVNFFVVRCRLVRMLKDIKCRATGVPRGDRGTEQTRLADRADVLSKEITDWMGNVEDIYKMRDLPPLRATTGQMRSNVTSQPSPPMASLSNPADCSSPRDFDGPTESDSLTLQRCELAVTAHHEILRLFLPVVHAMSFTVTEEDYPQRRNLEGLHAIDPALYIIRVCDLAFHTQRSRRSMLSTLSAFIFLRSLFDAAIVLAHIAIQHTQFASAHVLSGVRVALSIFRELDEKRNSIEISRRFDSEPVRVLEVLLQKGLAAANGAQASASGMKRGHEEVDSGSADIFRINFRLPFVGAGIVNVGTSRQVPVALASVLAAGAAHDADHESARVKLNKPPSSGSSEPMVPTQTWGVPPPDNQSPARRNSSSHSQATGRLSVRNRDSSKGDSARRNRGGSVSGHYPPHVHAQTVAAPRPQSLIISNSTSSSTHSQPTPVSGTTSPLDFAGNGYMDAGNFAPSVTPQPQAQNHHNHLAVTRPGPVQAPQFGPGPYPPPPPPPSAPSDVQQFHQSTFPTQTPYPYPPGPQAQGQPMQFFSAQGGFQVTPPMYHEGESMSGVPGIVNGGVGIDSRHERERTSPPDQLAGQEALFPIGPTAAPGDLAAQPHMSALDPTSQPWVDGNGWENGGYQSFHYHNGQQQ